MLELRDFDEIKTIFGLFKLHLEPYYFVVFFFFSSWGEGNHVLIVCNTSEVDMVKFEFEKKSRHRVPMFCSEC